VDQDKKESSYLKYFLYLASGYSFLTYLYYLTKELLANKFHDFAYYYIYTGLLQKGNDIFRYAEDPQIIARIKALASSLGFPQITIGLQHSPGFFFLVSPFAWLPFNAASASWVAFCQFSFLFFVISTCKILKDLDEWQILCAIFLVFNFWPLFENAHLAQVNFVVLPFLALAFLLLKNRQLFLAGISLGMAIQIKEVFFPMVLFLAAKRYWKAVWGLAAILVAVKVAAVFAFGIEKEVSYWRYITGYWLLTDKTPSVYNISIAASLGRFGMGLISARILRLALLPLFIFLLVKAWNLARHPGRENSRSLFLEYSLFISLCFIVNPWLNGPLLMILLLPLLAAWGYLVKHPAPADFMLFVIIYFALGLKYSVISFPFFAAAAFGYVLLFYLIYRLLKHSR
jgi:hypothetical protein